MASAEGLDKVKTLRLYQKECQFLEPWVMLSAATGDKRFNSQLLQNKHLSAMTLCVVVFADILGRRALANYSCYLNVEEAVA